jgi:signal transduction histidine kinase
VGDLADVLARGLDVYRYRLDREGMKLDVDIEPDLPPVRFDENAMTLVMLNLVDNAVKYAPDGKVLRVSLLRRGDQVLIEVADSGPGIPDDERERIFERFYRSRNVRGRTVRGSGIGLALVKHIVEAHGGAVEVESVVGKGSRFIVSLPTYHEPPEEEEEGNDASA